MTAVATSSAANASESSELFLQSASARLSWCRGGRQASTPLPHPPALKLNSASALPALAASETQETAHVLKI